MDNNENMQSAGMGSDTQNQQTNGNQYNGQTQYNQQFTQPNYNQTQFTPQYQAPMYQPPIEDTTPLSVGQWMLTTLVLALPCVGLIMAFVWAFGDGNVNRKNYCRSALIWKAIGIGLTIILYVVLIAVGLSLSDMGSSFSNSYYY